MRNNSDPLSEFWLSEKQVKKNNVNICLTDACDYFIDQEGYANLIRYVNICQLHLPTI